MKKHGFNLGFYFSIVVFCIMLASIALIFPLAAITASRGGFYGMDIIAVFVILYLVSLAAGVVISAIVGKRILNPVLRLGDAAKKIAGGDFSVRLEEDGRIEELVLMARNFNLMAQELGATETFRDDFIANISHEFKTPLAAIEGYAVLLRDAELSLSEKNQYIEKIITATRRLSRLSANILKISQLEGQEIITDKKKFRLDEQLRQALLMLEDSWSRKSLELDLYLDDEVIYYGNDELLMQAWLNIISNAVKFTPEGGRITVSLTEESENVVVRISDTGIGMDEYTVHHVFDKFYQADTSRKAEGNGLGLALVSRIIKLCGGTVTVASAPGAGSAFTVTLPKNREN